MPWNIDMNSIQHSWVFYLVLLVVFGEALALFTGLYIIQRRKHAWAGVKNAFFLTSDMLGAMLLCCLPDRIPSLIVLAFLVLSHAFRMLETVLHRSDAFCFNSPLVWVNALKTFALLGLLVFFLL